MTIVRAILCARQPDQRQILRKRQNEGGTGSSAMNEMAETRTPQAGQIPPVQGALLAMVLLVCQSAAGERMEPPRTLPSVVPVAAVANDVDTDGQAPRRASLEILGPLPGEPVPAPPMDPGPVATPGQENTYVAQSIATAIAPESTTGLAATPPDYPRPEFRAASGAGSAPHPPEESTTGPFVPLSSATRDPAHEPVTTQVSRRGSSGAAAAAVATGLCALAALALLIVWSRRNRERGVGLSVLASPASRATEERLSAPASALDDLINDVLPMVEEEPAFPAQLSFHGRTLGFRYLLLSGPHELRGPHFTAGQIGPTLRDRSGAGEPRNASRPLRSTAPPASLEDAGELRVQADVSPRTGDVPHDAISRTSNTGRRQPSPLERALLARHGRRRP